MVYNEDIGTTSILTVLIPSDEVYATTTLAMGDTLFIAGDPDDHTIRAFGIRKLHSGAAQ